MLGQSYRHPTFDLCHANVSTGFSGRWPSSMWWSPSRPPAGGSHDLAGGPPPRHGAGSGTQKVRLGHPVGGLLLFAQAHSTQPVKPCQSRTLVRLCRCVSTSALPLLPSFSESADPTVTGPDPGLAQLVSSYSLYERCLLRPAAAVASRDRADSLAGRVAALAARDAGATLLPTDWWYAPLMRLYERNNPQG